MHGSLMTQHQAKRDVAMETELLQSYLDQRREALLEIDTTVLEEERRRAEEELEQVSLKKWLVARIIKCV